MGTVNIGQSGVPFRGPASVGTTRLITIPTGAATEVVLGTGNVGMQVFNVGPSTIAWGDSAIEASSAGLLFYSMSKEFNPVSDLFSVFFVADSVAGTIALNEFA